MIGELRTRLGLYAPQTVPDEMGGVATSWVLQTILWAHVAPQNLRETTEQGRTRIIRTYKLTIRWRRNFPERARLIWGDRPLTVLSASDPDLRHERLHLICEEELQ